MSFLHFIGNKKNHFTLLHYLNLIATEYNIKQSKIYTLPFLN